jgi:hypothetical protein
MGGEKLYDCCSRNRGSNISLIGALSLDGLIATMSLPVSVNTEVFMTYIRQILVPLSPDDAIGWFEHCCLFM